jgi:hypothetical protein
MTGVQVKARDIPATIEYPGHMLAKVSHPLGDDHPNVEATKDRLRAKGYAIVGDAEALANVSTAGVAPALRTEALELLASARNALAALDVFLRNASS